MPKEPVVKKSSTVSAIINDALENKYVLNRFPTIDYKIPTGTLALDVMTDGGFHPGIIRLVGASMGGKTSEAFQLMQSVFQIRPNSRGIYIKTEKLSAKTRKQIGVKIVSTNEEWDNHTCLMIECNVYDVVSQLIIDLIYSQLELPEEEREQFVFVIDSLDFLMLESDLEKTAKESFKVAGPQVITKKLMTKVVVPMAKFGHLGIFISQVTAQPKIDPYAKVIPRLAGEISGGNALIHAADHILEFGHRNNGDYILEDMAQKPDAKNNKVLGHMVTIAFKKSDNEKYNQRVKYPIRYGREDGKSVWLEREVGDKLIEYGLISKKGSWFEIPEYYMKELAKHDVTAKFQGMATLYKLLEEKPAVNKFFYEKVLLSTTKDSIVLPEEDET